MSRFPLWVGGAASGSTRVYTRGDVDVLPGDDTNLENTFTSGEYTQVESDDADRVAQTATDEHAIFLFKDKAAGESSMNVTWNGQSDLAPSESTVHLEVYNQNSTDWESLDTDSATAANTDFDLTGSIPDLTNYKDGSDFVACRVYQDAT